MAEVLGKMKLSDEGEAAFLEMQDVFAKYNLSATDGMCCAGDFFIWALMVAFVDKKACKEQMTAMFPSMLENVDANWDGLEERKNLLAALERGVSGGRLQ